jgi:hypothetical protein
MNKLIPFVLLAALAWAGAGKATTASVRDAEIERTLVTDQGRYGSCMALLNKELADYGLNCPSRWVSFSCSGEFASKDVAYRMFDSAQLAFALGHRVTVRVDDTKKHDGYCYADMIYVYP